MKQEMIPLLRKGVEWAEAEAKKPWIDRRWWQNSYLTPAMNLGYALVAYVGFKTSKKQQDQIFAYCGTCYCMAGWLGQELDPRYATAEIVEGVHVADFVAKEMGFTHEESKELFSGSNTIGDVRRVAEEIAREPL